MEWTIRRTRYHFTVSNPEHLSQGIAWASLDGTEVDAGAIPVVEDGQTHRIRIVLGAGPGLRVAAAAADAITESSGGHD